MRLFLILIYVIPLHLAGQDAVKDSIRIELKEVGCELTNKEIQEIKKVAQYEYEFYKSIFPSDSLSVRVELYKNLNEYKEVQRKFYGNTTTHFSGFHSRQQKKSFVYKHDNFLSTIHHEISHAIIFEKAPLAPKWINEGLAEYFEASYTAKKGVITEISKWKLRITKNWADKKLVDLDKFILFDAKEWTAQNTPSYYSYRVSYAMVVFLMEKDKSIIKKMLIEFQKGYSTEDVINEIYTGGYASFKKDFFSFINKW